MTTITLPNGISITDPSEQVLAAVLSSIKGAEQISYLEPNFPAKVERKATEGKNTNSGAKVGPKPVHSAGTVSLNCKQCGSEFEKAISRGRYPSVCDDCKGGHSTGASEASEQAETPKSKPKNSGRKGGKGRRNFEPKPLDEMPDDKPASDAQLDRIRVQLKERKIPTAAAKKHAKAINSEPRISVRAAASLYRTLKALPLA